jgi:hypothetical protein
LVSATLEELSDPRRRGRSHVLDELTAGDEPLSQVRPSLRAFSTAHCRCSKLAAHVSSRRYPLGEASICIVASTLLPSGAIALAG